MTVEFIGMIHHREASEIKPPPPMIFDNGYIRDFAQAAEAGGFDKVLVGYFSDGPDGFMLAAAAAAHTTKLGFLLAHRPGFIAPTLAARKLATLDQITNGRAAVHIISGGDDTDQFRDGDTLGKQDRYARTDEYVEILKRIWTEPGPTVDHEGRFYRFAGASTAMRCVQQPHIPIYFGGASDAAIAASARHADVYALWGETHDQVREITTRVRAEAARHNRTIRFSLSMRPILAATEDAAWARAEAIKQTIIQRRAAAGLGQTNRTSEGSKRLLAAAAQGERLDKRLWTGAAMLTGASGNTTALVGTPYQVAEALCDYYDLGVTTFLIRGFDPLADNVEFGASLLPLTRRMIAERSAEHSTTRAA
jgi:alkanesulfonate monooxygenase